MTWRHNNNNNIVCPSGGTGLPAQKEKNVKYFALIYAYHDHKFICMKIVNCYAIVLIEITSIVQDVYYFYRCVLTKE